MKKAGFTLVELMIAASVLALGIVMVARSFLGAQDAFSATEDKLTAIKLLQSKMNELELKVYEEKGYQPQDAQEEVALGSKKGIFTLTTLNQKDTNAPDISAAQAKENQEQKKPLYSEVELKVSWQDRLRNKDESVVACFKNKKV